jgi:hypothetical protein
VAGKIALVLAIKPILLLLALAESAPVPGTFSGLVTNSAGRPLAGAEVVIHGTTSTGRHASFEQRTDAQGRYSVRVPRGVYAARAYGNLVWNGKSYRLLLHPVDNDNNRSYDANPGVVKDFVWRLSGLKAYRNLDPERAESYYGGTIQIVLRDPMRNGLEAIAEFAPATVLEIFLNPIGTLLDGSAARPLLFKSNTSGNSPDQRVLKDVPAGRYVLTARARTPSDSVLPLRVAAAVHEGGTPALPAKSIEIDFQPSKLLGPSSDGFENITLYVMN